MYRFKLFETLTEPPVTAAQLPPNVPLPPGDFPGGLPDRFGVAGVNHFSLEEAGLVTLQVAVTTTSGTYTQQAQVHTALPWRPFTGIRNVPIGAPILLHGRLQAAGTYDWTLTVPAGSNAVLAGGDSRVPEFTPDIPGIYVVQVTDQANSAPVRFEVYAGTWRGIIVAQDANGRPIAEGVCTSCHRPGFVVDKFTPWAQTGHAEIFTDNLNTSTHYSSACWDCHTVGYDPGIANRGIDEAFDFQAFLNAGLINNPGDNWTKVLQLFPGTAKLANIQCENCHGPANSAPGLDTLAHGWMSTVDGKPRTSLSADVCGSCHGEPLRHGRFQQWQLSGHANYEVAIAESQSTSCARCHTVNGFLAWLPILKGDEPGDPTASLAEIGWTPDEAHPQTCVTCHDPHDIGTTTGIGTNAKIRISGTTPPLAAGYQVFGAGRGAICITCHNTRNGLYNDDVFDSLSTSDKTRAPHTAAQADVLMGETAYLVQAGIRGRHSLIGDTCVQCHMEKTPPPDILSYELGGSNHTFFARPEVCNECHTGLDGTGLFAAVEAELQGLEGAIEAKFKQTLTAQIAAGNSIQIGSRTITNAADIASVTLGEARGRHAIGINFTDGTSVGLTSVQSVMVVRPAPMPAVQLYEVADPGLIKATHNYLLLEGDGSMGAHNPSFVLAVLAASRSAVGARGGARLMLPADLPELNVDEYLKR
jgi:formate-dependent nitrite reductase cytochrome c552 subunit